MFTITVTHYDLAIGQALSIESPVIHPPLNKVLLQIRKEFKGPFQICCLKHFG